MESFDKKPDQSKRGLSRRGFLRGAAAGLAMSQIPGTANAESVDSDEAVLDHYQETGQIENIDALFELFIKNEPTVRYNQDWGEAIPVEEDFESVLEQFTITVGSRLSEVNPALDTPLRLRVAIEEILDQVANEVSPSINDEAFINNDSPFVYNREAASIYDIVLNGRLQCRSGSMMYMYLASKLLSSEDMESLVLINTEGHVLPGYERDDGVYVGLDMTGYTENWPEFEAGSGQELGAFRVTRATSAIAENLIGEQLYPESVILLEEGVSELTPATETDLQQDLIANRQLRDLSLSTYTPNTTDWHDTITPSVYGFSLSAAPDGDLERPDVDNFSYIRKQFNEGDQDISLPMVFSIEDLTKVNQLPESAVAE